MVCEQNYFNLHVAKDIQRKFFYFTNLLSPYPCFSKRKPTTEAATRLIQHKQVVKWLALAMMQCKFVARITVLVEILICIFFNINLKSEETH